MTLSLAGLYGLACLTLAYLAHHEGMGYERYVDDEDRCAQRHKRRPRQNHALHLD